jgi:tetratricopeptide (TPR) repeat protein
VERLPTLARSLLQAAAVAGRVFDYAVVRLAGDWPEAEAVAALDELLARGLVREAQPAGELAFAHHLVQEAIYAGLAAPRRAFWHRRVLLALEQLCPDDFAGLAHHALAAGERDRAIDYSRRAAQRARGLHAYDEAIRHLRPALDLADPARQPELRLAVLEALADNQRLVRQGLEAIRTYLAALDLCQAAGLADPLTTIRLHRRVFQTLFVMRETARRENYDQAARLVAALRPNLPGLLAHLEREPPHREHVALLQALAVDAAALREPDDWDAALGYCQAAIALAERLAAPVELSSALSALATLYSLRGRLPERLAAARRALEVDRDPAFHDPRQHVDSLIGAAAALVHLGDYHQALAFVAEAETLSDQVQAVDRQNWALSMRVYCLYRLDRWDELLATEARRRELQDRYQLERVGAPCFSIALAAAIHGLRGELTRSRALQAESAAIMTLVSGPPERWARSQHY